MKNILVYGFTTLVVSCLMSNHIYSQSGLGIAESAMEKNNLDTNGSIREGEINVKAVYSFLKKYKNVTNAKWFISTAGLFGVYFTNEGVQTFVYYNKRGVYEFQVSNYKEDKLPNEVRNLIKTNYYDFDIYHVTEVSRNGKVAYGVNIKDKNSRKTVKIVDGEMEVITEYTNAGR